MEFITDLHLHSKYSRAVSPRMMLSEMARVGRQKGTDILSSADFTHPVWFKEISSQLIEATEGLYTLKPDLAPHPGESEIKEQYFILATEIACIYNQDGKVRRIHNLVIAPSIDIAGRISGALLKRGANLSADGRPIIGLSSRDLLELILSIDERCVLIPCHVWTPHFGVYGSASGFDSLDEAFGDLSQYVYGIETGLSSDPEMNWTMKELRHRSILSFSDAHSLPKMGREATVFELTEPTYENIRRAIMRPSVIANGARQSFKVVIPDYPKGSSYSVAAQADDNKNRIVYTIEFYPEEGKYHFSGHRTCKVVFTPKQTKEFLDICSVCGRKLTEGVFVRVGQLGDVSLSHILEIRNENGVQWFTDKTHHHPPYVKLVQLLQICAESVGTSVNSQKANALFELLCLRLGSEMEILLKTPLSAIREAGGKKVADGIDKVRRGEIDISPGFDGVYGKVRIWSGENISSELDQRSLL